MTVVISWNGIDHSNPLDLVGIDYISTSLILPDPCWTLVSFMIILLLGWCLARFSLLHPCMVSVVGIDLAEAVVWTQIQFDI